MPEFDPTSTTVEEIHEIICDRGAEVANSLVAEDQRIKVKKWRGGDMGGLSVFRGVSPYNGGGLSLEITEEFRGAPDYVRAIYRELAITGVRKAIIEKGDIFAGMVLGEARAGRNYFARYAQAPTQLFD